LKIFAWCVILGSLSLLSLFGLVAALATLDEEWDGWKDFLGNPYFVAFFVFNAAAIGWALVCLMRRWRD
jgi:fumarate reductase subunit C